MKNRTKDFVDSLETRSTNPQIAEEGTDAKGKKTTTSKKKKVKIVKEEVSRDEVMKHIVSFSKQKDNTYRDELLGMVGNSVEDVRSFLNGLKADNVIQGWREVPIGAIITLELRPGFLTVLMDAENVVLDIQGA